MHFCSRLDQDPFSLNRTLSLPQWRGAGGCGESVLNVEEKYFSARLSDWMRRILSRSNASSATQVELESSRDLRRPLRLIRRVLDVISMMMTQESLHLNGRFLDPALLIVEFTTLCSVRRQSGHSLVQEISLRRTSWHQRCSNGVSSLIIAIMRFKRQLNEFTRVLHASLFQPVMTDARLEGWRIEPSSLKSCTPARCLYFCCSLVPSGPPPIFFSSVRT